MRRPTKFGTSKTVRYCKHGTGHLVSGEGRSLGKICKCGADHTKNSGKGGKQASSICLGNFTGSTENTGNKALKKKQGSKQRSQWLDFKRECEDVEPTYCEFADEAEEVYTPTFDMRFDLSSTIKSPNSKVDDDETCSIADTVVSEIVSDDDFSSVAGQENSWEVLDDEVVCWD